MEATVRVLTKIITITWLLGSLVSCNNVEQATPPALGSVPDMQVKHFEFSSGMQIEQLFRDLDYKPEGWLSGVREVPRLFITDIPSHWRDKNSLELDIVTKKRVFFLFLGPLVLHANELIQANRDRVVSIIRKLRTGASVSIEDQDYLHETAVAYKATEGEIDLNDPVLQDKVLRRVDTLPPSLVLAQAAEESGWGTSRFAVEGNALFGMWTWGGKGLTPLKQRSDFGHYKIAAYETLLQSVLAYMHNLNTHQAYKKLRARRFELRKAGAKVTGLDLVNTLMRYSERGQAYVDSIKSLIKGNRLQPTDDAYLGDGPTILLIPVESMTNRLASR